MSDWEAEGYLEICGDSILSLLRTWQPRSLATETIGTRSSLSDRAQELSEQVFLVEMGEDRSRCQLSRGCGDEAACFGQHRVECGLRLDGDGRIRLANIHVDRVEDGQQQPSPLGEISRRP